jgi:hypothetical protein
MTTKTGRWGEIHLHYEEYIDGISPVSIPAQRRRTPEPPLTSGEQSQLLEINGKLMWVRQQIMPMTCAPLSYFTTDMKAGTIASLVESNRLAKIAKEHAK